MVFTVLILTIITLLFKAAVSTQTGLIKFFLNIFLSVLLIKSSNGVMVDALTAALIINILLIPISLVFYGKKFFRSLFFHTSLYTVVFILIYVFWNRLEPEVNLLWNHFF